MYSHVLFSCDCREYMSCYRISCCSLCSLCIDIIIIIFQWKYKQCGHIMYILHDKMFVRKSSMFFCVWTRRSEMHCFFYRATLCASALLDVSLCLSLCLSVCPSLILVYCMETAYDITNLFPGLPHARSGVVRIDLLRFLAGCRTRRLNQV